MPDLPDLPAYTVAAVAAPVAVVALELLVLRTGLLRQGRYWLALAMLLGFQVPFGGWLTKPHATVVVYVDEPTIGVRAPLWFPVEDFGFGFAMITLTLLVWHWYGRQPRPAPSGDARS